VPFVGVEVEERTGSAGDRPARSSIRTARSAPSRECSTPGDRAPCGVSISESFQ